MSAHTIILILLSLFELGLMGYVLVAYQRTPSIYALAGLLFGFGAMSFLVGLIPIVESESLRLFLGRAGFYSGAITFASLIVLAAYYPLPSVLPKSSLKLVVLLPLLFFLPFIFLYDGFLRKVEIFQGSAQAITGSGFWALTVFSAGALLFSLALMFKKKRFVSGQQRRQVGYFISLMLCTGVIGLITDFVLPHAGIRVNSSLGLEGGGVVALFIASIVLRKV